MEKAIECLAGFVFTSNKSGDTLPPPSALSDIDPIAVARELDPDSPVGECFVNMISVDVASYAKTHFEKPVKKTLSIPMWLNNAAIAQNINFSQVLQEALLVKLHLNNS